MSRYATALEAARNPDGAYDAVRFLASLSGLELREVQWIAHRVQHLMRTEGKTADEAKGIVLKEAKERPWERS